ncbi:hypothetical protein [Angelakisella massiliensis]|uniref:hypothetical protein n=1 Tax=Angelakisella massiliensis TaxID=1871018 RepID=UPI0023A89C10|nr:hypothetical protein [Angelakisella massiliensis]
MAQEQRRHTGGFFGGMAGEPVEGWDFSVDSHALGATNTAGGFRGTAAGGPWVNSSRG